MRVRSVLCSLEVLCAIAYLVREMDPGVGQYATKAWSRREYSIHHLANKRDLESGSTFRGSRGDE